MKKAHRRDVNNAIRSTTHASAVVFAQQNSLKAVVRAVPVNNVRVGADGKPGAPPPEKAEFVYDMAVFVLCLKVHVMCEHTGLFDQTIV